MCIFNAAPVKQIVADGEYSGGIYTTQISGSINVQVSGLNVNIKVIDSKTQQERNIVGTFNSHISTNPLNLENIPCFNGKYNDKTIVFSKCLWGQTEDTKEWGFIALVSIDNQIPGEILFIKNPK